MFQEVTDNNRKQNNNKNESNFINKIEPFLYIISIIILPVLAIIILFFALVRQIVNIILKIKYKQEYAGLLCSADSVWAVEDDASRSIMHAVFMVRCDNEDKFYEKLSKIVAEKFGAIPKLTSTRKEFMGYYYLLKDKIDPTDCVRKIDDDVRDEEGLKDFLSKTCNSALPKDSAAMWECYIGTKGIKWRNKKSFHPIIFRFHHTIGDGWAVLNVIYREIFKEITPQTLPQTKAEVLTATIKFDLIRFVYICVKFFTSFVKGLQIVLMAPIRIAHIGYLRPDDKNPLHGPDLSGEKIAVWTTEEAVELVPICKDIRKQFGGLRFTDIMFAAVGAGLYKYFKRNDIEVPQYMTSIVPVLMMPQTDESKLMLRNNISMTVMDVPVLVKPFSMLQLLEESVRQAEKMRNLPDVQVNYWLLNHFSGILPLPLLRIILNTSKMSIGVSNLPGPGKQYVLHDYDVEDCAFYPPNRGNTGVIFLVSTYDNKFQLTLMVDKILISSKEEVQTILDDVFNSLKLLNEERKNMRTDRKKEL